jgi:hypothetical protein
VYYNFKSGFARCFTNITYGLWAVAVVCQWFYALLLPKASPLYDHIHYRNYFMATSLIVIILQDLNFLRMRVNERSRQAPVSTVSQFKMTEMGASSNGLYKGFEQVEAAFASGDDLMLDAAQTDLARAARVEQRESKLDDEHEDVYFDVGQFDKRGARTDTVTQNLCTAAPNKRRDDVEVNIRFRERPGPFRTFVDNNQTLLVCLFVGLLLASWLLFTIVLFKMTLYSVFSLITLIFYPALIFACSTLNKMSYL